MPAPEAVAPAPPRTLPFGRTFPAIPLALTVVLAAFALFPPVRDDRSLALTFLGVSAGLLAWAFVLWARSRTSGRSFLVELVPPLKSHYIQASVQICVYAYWGWYWRPVYDYVPLIFGQLVFLYAFDALLTWSRGRPWRLGFGPLPIILSTNVFLWFENDTFFFQFLLVATGALGKEFIKWTRDGRRTHIFNPSAFTLALFSIVLLATNTTDATFAGRIADTVAVPPQIYVVIFGLGLIVQFFFSTTLMTVSAVVVLCLLNAIYKSQTGTYFFVFTNIPAPVFLGLHLLVTDPSTSPRTNLGRVIFGSLYGLLTFAFYGLLTALGAPTVYDKLLPVPLLNLSVRWIDRITAPGTLGALGRIGPALQPRRLNLVHMAGWVLIFGLMMRIGYVQAPHEGSTYQFWKQALDEGKPTAAHGLLEVVKSQARDGHAAAWNELGLLYLEGKIVEKDPTTAVRYFSQAAKLGSVAGAANLVHQYLTVPDPRPVKAVDAAIEMLEDACREGTDPALYAVMGRVYETGRGRRFDLARARAYYKAGCERGNAEACEGVARIPAHVARAAREAAGDAK